MQAANIFRQVQRSQRHIIVLRQRCMSSAVASSSSPPAPLPVESLEHLSESALSEDQRAFRDLARDFSLAELQPNAAKWDRESYFPVETLRQAASLGFGAMFVSEDYGGTGLGRADGALIVEELAAGCTSTTAYLTIHNMCAWMIDTYGSVDQRESWLPRMAGMDVLASYCLTEPNSGSDAASLSTKAEYDPETDEFVLHGSKAFISGAGTTDVYLVMARSGGIGTGAGGVSCFLVEKGMPGLSFGENEAKMGWKSQPTRAVFFDGVRVPAKTHLLGEEGQGFKIAMSGLDGGRLSIGACSLGAAKCALETAASYVKERKQFGVSLATQQSVQFKLADMATDLHGARLMLHYAANLMDRQKLFMAQSDGAVSVPGGARTTTVACAMAKQKATDVGFRVCNDALQLHGGYGYLASYSLERHVRDVRVHQILEGTNEIMRHIISREICK